MSNSDSSWFSLRELTEHRLPRYRALKLGCPQTGMHDDEEEQSSDRLVDIEGLWFHRSLFFPQRAAGGVPVFAALWRANTGAEQVLRTLEI